MASTLAQLTSEAEIPAGQPLSEYGLGDDARVIRFESSDASHGLRIGNGTPVGSNSYVAALDSDEVYTVPTWRAQ